MRRIAHTHPRYTAAGIMLVCLVANQVARDTIGVGRWYGRIVNLATGVGFWIALLILVLMVVLPHVLDTKRHEP